MSSFLSALIVSVGLQVSGSVPTSVDGIVEAHTNARGGAPALESVASVDIRLLIDEGWQAEAHYRATRDGDMRIDVVIDGVRVFSEGLHDGEAWSLAQGATQGSPITNQEAQILWRGVLGNVYGLHEFADQGVRLTTGPAHEDGAPSIELRHPDGFEERVYFSPETWLITRRRSDHALHPAADPEQRRFESRYSDFRDVDGITFAFESTKTDLDTGEIVQQTSIRSIELNTISDRSDFHQPGQD